ncbi:MAG: hypothetical protein HQM08_09740 [Candidatus Riflebacteria bacterium]|nr:hypothetical protein [Candidatus Riflebacteria bacterium]
MQFVRVILACCLKSRKGVVFAIVLLLLSFLGLFFFAYRQMVSTQNRESAHLAESELTSRLAVEGVEFLGNVLRNANFMHGSELKDKILPSFFKTQNLNDKDLVLASGTCLPGGTPKDPNYWLDKAAADFQMCLEQISRSFQGNQNLHPFCQGLGIKFDKLSCLRMHPPRALDLESGWDIFERRGEVVLSCSVYFMGASRLAVARRQFKLVSFIPGPYSRFTLFVHHAPQSGCYNVVHNCFDGSIDTRGGDTFQPLVLYNTTAPMNEECSASVSSAKEELHTKGWVYLGQCPQGNWNRDPSSLNGLVSLRIPSGYFPRNSASTIEDTPVSSSNSASGEGGHFYLCPPATLKNGNIGAYAYPVQDSGLHNSNISNGPFNINMHFQGFYTYDPTTNDQNDKGAADLGLWAGVSGSLQPENCITSWIFPFGDRRQPSRSLIFGAAFAEFLQYYTLSGPNGTAVILGRNDPTYFDPNSPVMLKPSLVNMPNSNDFFVSTSADPPGKPGWLACQMVMPRIIQARSFGNVCCGVAANLIFDMMAYQQLPDLNRSRSIEPWGIGQLPTLSFSIPGNNSTLPLNDMDTMSPNFHSCIQPLTNVHIQRYHDSGTFSQNADENTVFLGNLQKVFFATKPSNQPPFNECVVDGLLSRVTHLIDLKGVSGNLQKEILCAQVFNSSADATGREEWSVNKPGIFLLQRNTNDDDLVLPSPIRLNKPAIIILNHGNFAVQEKIVDISAAGTGNRQKAPSIPFSLVALDGNIKIPPEKEIHAFLVALNTSLSVAPNSAGKILSSSSTSGAGTNSRMIIKGGVAVGEVATNAGKSTISEFPAGGVIRYNPIFNVSLPSVWGTYGLIVEDQNASLEICGGR